MKLLISILFLIASNNAIDAVENERKTHLRNVDSSHNNKSMRRFLQDTTASAVPSAVLSAVPSAIPSAVPSAVVISTSTDGSESAAPSIKSYRPPYVPLGPDGPPGTDGTDSTDPTVDGTDSDSTDPTDDNTDSDSTDSSSSDSTDSAYLEASLQVLDTDYCVNVPQKSQDGENNILKVWNCKPQNKKNQRFQIALDTGMIYAKISNSTKCLTLDFNKDGKLFNGALVTYVDCGSTDDDLKQRWAWQPDGSNGMVGLLQSQWRPNKCMKGSTQRGKSIRIDNCLKGDDLMWELIDTLNGTF